MKVGELEIAIIDVITFTGILITLLTGVLNLFQTKKTLYINNITRFRVIWITELRMHIATLKELSNITNLYISTQKGVNKMEYRRELEKVVSLIKMHLNFNGTLDKQIILKVQELKTTINSYLLIYHLKNSIEQLKEKNEIKEKFREIINIVSEKRILEELLNIAKVYNEKNKNLKEFNLIDLKRKVIKIYLSNDDISLIKNVILETENIINNYEENIEELNNDIDEMIQICLKAEWIRCKSETKIWPYNKYNENKIIAKLKNQYETIK